MATLTDNVFELGPGKVEATQAVHRSGRRQKAEIHIYKFVLKRTNSGIGLVKIKIYKSNYQPESEYISFGKYGGQCLFLDTT